MKLSKEDVVGAVFGTGANVEVFFEEYTILTGIALASAMLPTLDCLSW